MPLKLVYLIIIFGAVKSYAVEQCPDLPIPIQFYRGQPGELNIKDLTDVFQGLMSSLTNIFQSISKSANSSAHIIDFNSTDFSNNWNFTWFNETGGNGNVFALNSHDQTPKHETVGALAPDNGSTAAPTEGLDAQTVLSTRAPTPAPSNLFNLGSFFNSILPGNQLTNNASSVGSLLKGKEGAPPLKFDLKFGSPQEPSSTSSPVNQSTNNWGITVPLNTLVIEIAKINNSVIVETFTVDSNHLSSNKSTKDFKRFIQNVDLSDFNIEPNLFYVICIKSLIVQENKKIECQRCVLLRPCEKLSCKEEEKILAFQAPSSKVHPYDVRLHFFVYDSPLPNSSLVTRVQPRQPEARCPPLRRGGPQSLSDQSSGSNNGLTPFDKFERADRLYPNSILYVTVPNLSPREAYSVEGDLLLDVASASSDSKAPFDWANPLLIGNYFGAPAQEYIIGACNRPF